MLARREGANYPQIRYITAHALVNTAIRHIDMALRDNDIGGTLYGNERLGVATALPSIL